MVNWANERSHDGHLEEATLEHYDIHSAIISQFRTPESDQVRTVSFLDASLVMK